MSDALEQAKKYLQDSIEIPLERGQDESIACVQTAQAAALIAQVEATRAQNAILERIAVVLEGVYDPDAAMLRVEAWTWDSRRELG